jgi:hypothetical protein
MVGLGIGTILGALWATGDNGSNLRLIIPAGSFFIVLGILFLYKAGLIYKKGK